MAAVAFSSLAAILMRRVEGLKMKMQKTLTLYYTVQVHAPRVYIYGLVTPGETVMNFFIEFNQRQLHSKLMFMLRAAFHQFNRTTNYGFIFF
jgi:hypothetical protein